MSGVSPAMPSQTALNKVPETSEQSGASTIKATSVPPSESPSLSSNSTHVITVPHFCPPLVMNGLQRETLIVSTNDTRAGTVVVATCKGSWKHLQPAYLLCDASGSWNATKPTCSSDSSWLGLTSSNHILTAVFTGCGALVFFVVCVICCRLLCNRNSARTHTEARLSRQQTQSPDDHYDEPKGLAEAHYQSSDVTRLHYAKPEVNASRPEIYSTFINPVFYEDAYTRWRMDEQARHDSTYEVPWQYSRRLHDQSDNPEIKWSTLSLRAHDNYDYKNFSRIPRGRLSSDSETEYADSIGTETQVLTTF